MLQWRLSLVSLALAGLGGAMGLDVHPAEKSVAERMATSAPAGLHPVAADRPSAVVKATRSQNGLFYADLDLNGQRVRFLVDTGSTHMVLTGSDARAIGLAPGTGAAGLLVTAGGQRHARWAHLDGASVAGQPVGDVDALVVADGIQTSLLGQNVLTRLGPLTIDGDTLTISHR